MASHHNDWIAIMPIPKGDLMIVPTASASRRLTKTVTMAAIVLIVAVALAGCASTSTGAVAQASTPLVGSHAKLNTSTPMCSALDCTLQFEITNKTSVPVHASGNVCLIVNGKTFEATGDDDVSGTVQPGQSDEVDGEWFSILPAGGSVTEIFVGSCTDESAAVARAPLSLHVES